MYRLHGHGIGAYDPTIAKDLEKCYGGNVDACLGLKVKFEKACVTGGDKGACDAMGEMIRLLKAQGWSTDKIQNESDALTDDGGADGDSSGSGNTVLYVGIGVMVLGVVAVGYMLTRK